MATIVESFHNAGAADGALIRRLVGTELQTVLVMRPDPGTLYRAEHLIGFSTDVTDWHRYSYRQQPGEVDLDIDRGRRTGIPSYAEYLLVRRMITDGLAVCDYDRVSDGDADDVRAARLTRADDPELITTPGNDVHQTTRIDLEVDGVVVNVFWCDEGGPVLTDWNGARSWRTDWQTLAPQLDDEVRAAVVATDVLRA